MSNHSYRELMPPPKHSMWPVIAVLLIIPFILSLNFIHWPPTRANWQTSGARVLGTRIVVAGTRDAYILPAEIYYRGEAHVTYTAGRKQYDQWLPATDTIDDRNRLASYLSSHSVATGEVKWNPANPAQGRVTLRLP